MNTKQLSQLDQDETEALRAIGWRPAANDSGCPDSSLLLAVNDDVLDDGLADRVRAHVKVCGTCQMLANDLAIVLAQDPSVDEVATIRARVTTLAAPSRRAPRVWVGLGGLALAAGLAGVYLWPRPVPPPQPDVQIAKVTPPSIPSVFVVSRPLIPPGDVELTVRGESTKISLPNEIASALDKADAGDVATVASDLARVVKVNPASRSAALALGSVQLRANQNAEAAATLERARALKSDPELADETDWFLSIALVRTNNRAGARALLADVCKRGGPRSASACAGVAEIDRTSR